MVLRKICFVGVLICLAFKGHSQYSETIRSARPGQAFGPFTTGKDVFQVQTGFTYSEQSAAESEFYSESLDYIASFRYSFWEKLEFRTAFVLSNENQEGMFGMDDLQGLRVLKFGTRYNILEGGGYRPAIGAQFETSLPTVSEDFEREDPSFRFSLLHSQKLFWNLNLTTNWFFDWSAMVSQNTGGYVVNLSFPITEKLGGFVETYGNYNPNQFGEDDFSILFDGGLAYLLNPDLQFDVSTGVGDNGGINSWFVDLGVSWRIRFTDKS